MTDLRSRIEAELDRREKRTAAMPDHYEEWADAKADQERRYAHARKMLKRHTPVERRDYGNDNWLACVRCALDVTYRSCEPLRDLAESLGVGAE